VILVGALALVLVLLGYFLGEAFLGSGLWGLIIALVVWIIMNLIAYFQGDALILSISRAKKIGPNDHPRLWNVVEEMKIASGLEKMPDVYIIDDPAMNAFATGRSPKHAAVTVTSGLLQKMNRDELQGVVAHEISHIQNRDVLLMTLCSVLLGTIVILAWYGSRILIFSGGSGGRRRSGGGGGGSGAAIILVVALVLAILAPIFAQLIYFAISRKREYLADASGALYTRYPEGLASALEKIADSTIGLHSANQAFAPMYIANPFRKEGMSASDLTSTHPPIRERIRILRSMAGGASFVEYNKAYQKVRNNKQNVIPASTLAVSAAMVSTRQPEPAPDQSESEQKIDRAREVSAALDKLHKYTALACPCGTAFRIPPDYKGKVIRCPRCGRDNQIMNK